MPLGFPTSSSSPTVDYRVIDPSSSNCHARSFANWIRESSWGCHLTYPPRPTSRIRSSLLACWPCQSVLFGSHAPSCLFRSAAPLAASFPLPLSAAHRSCVRGTCPRRPLFLVISTPQCLPPPHLDSHRLVRLDGLQGPRKPQVRSPAVGYGPSTAPTSGSRYPRACPCRTCNSQKQPSCELMVIFLPDPIAQHIGMLVAPSFNAQDVPLAFQPPCQCFLPE